MMSVLSKSARMLNLYSVKKSGLKLTVRHLLQVVVDPRRDNDSIAASSDLRLRAAEASIYLRQVSNRLAEQMNRAMYTLSVVAGIFLPLSLLTGLLGINVGGIPGTESKWAFSLVSLGLIVVAIGLIRWFKKIKWL